MNIDWMATPHQEIDTLRQYKKNKFRFLAQKKQNKKVFWPKKINNVKIK